MSVSVTSVIWSSSPAICTSLSNSERWLEKLRASLVSDDGSTSQTSTSIEATSATQPRRRIPATSPYNSPFPPTTTSTARTTCSRKKELKPKSAVGQNSHHVAGGRSRL